jgi:5-methyltetrahydropteroyltriglutamate--homocysteine methyltransferase
MLDIRFREKFQDAMAVVISDRERSGLDILSHGDLHVDEDLAGARHHYPLQRWAGFGGDHLRRKRPLLLGCIIRREPWNEIYTGWRWPQVVDKIEHRPLDYPKLWRLARARNGEVRHLLFV